ncbi:MAG: hypothetical protein ACJA0U_000114 [Salibacteraceae bacterium]|jgi:hypothetical protein
MLKYWKWGLLAIILTIVVYNLPPFYGKIDENFSQDDFRRYDLFISDAVIHKMDSLARPVNNNFTYSKTWFKAKVLRGYDTLEAKIRLKGDKIDHYDTELLSWRLKYKVNGDKNIVSLQHPKTRTYISEWIFHKLLEQEGLPYLKYDFVSVYVNNKFKGLYAEEEHFSNHNIERNWNRVHGPILRFEDDKYWPAGLHWEDPKFIPGIYQEAEIRGFNYKKEERNSDVYKRAVVLLNDYRNGQLPVNQIFDLQLLAKFYALTDLVGGHHGLRWINCRYYYNPETNLFEPAGFDSNATRINKLAIHDERLNPHHQSKITSNPEFLKHYYHYLSIYSKKKFLDDFYRKHDAKLNLYLEAFNDQFNVDKSSLKSDLYLNQWVIFYNLNKKALFVGLFLIIGLIVFLQIKKRRSRNKPKLQTDLKTSA